MELTAGVVPEHAPARNAGPGPTPLFQQRVLRRRVALMLPLRLVGFAAFQGVIAATMVVAGRSDPWADSVAWWPIAAVMTNLLTLALLIWLMRQEGQRWSGLFRIDTMHVGRDAATVLGLTIVSMVLVLGPNLGLAMLLFGDAEAPLATFIQPLPPWAVVTTLALFPVTIALAELAVYFGYVQPRLEALTGHAWVAVALATCFLSLQHAALPLVFEWRFALWRSLMFLPFALMLAVVLRWRPRLLPYVAILHGLADLQVAIMIVAASS